MTVLSKLLAPALAFTIAGAPLVHATDHSRTQSTDHASTSEAVGVGTGLAIGAAVGGPVGAILGAAIGGHYGDTHHQSKINGKLAAQKKAELEASMARLDKSMSAQAALDRELVSAQHELDELTQRIEQLFVERALVNGLQFDLHFDTDDSALASADTARLVRLSELLRAVPEAEVNVVGFADTRGADEHNEILSLDRAETVASTLAELGVGRNQINTSAQGESLSTYSGPDPDGYAHDRRVSVRLELPMDLPQPQENARVASDPDQSSF